MKTIGKALKDARIKKKYSLSAVEDSTKIKKVFIEALEKEDWEALPEFPVVAGFVKNISAYLEIDQQSLMALLRRDYPPKSLPVNPKPDVGREFHWSPKLTFVVGVAIFITLILGYLGFQYIEYVSPPELSLQTPVEGQLVENREIIVSGKTDPEATVKVNNQTVLVDDKGDFTIELEISEKTSEIEVVATARSGKTSGIKRTIMTKF